VPAALQSRKARGSARRAKTSRGLLVLTSVVVVALLVAWLYFAFVHGVQENCDPDCVTDDEVAGWLAAFLVALMLWIALIARRRGRRDEVILFPPTAGPDALLCFAEPLAQGP
jgi:succinate dehydrogenase hydrophobic anchor subunit